jgi:hypothetical protein
MNDCVFTPSRKDDKRNAEMISFVSIVCLLSSADVRRVNMVNLRIESNNCRCGKPVEKMTLCTDFLIFHEYTISRRDTWTLVLEQIVLIGTILYTDDDIDQPHMKKPK